MASEDCQRLSSAIPTTLRPKEVPGQPGVVPSVSSFKFDQYCCDGVYSVCRGGRIVQLNLANTGLAGTFPDLTGLDALSVLDISNNDVTGPIHASVWSLSNLERLWINDNKLSGSLSNDIGNLQKIIVISLTASGLTGSIPDSLGKAQAMYWLDLSSNGLIGDLPSSLGNLVNLDTIILSENQLTGSIPSSFASLSKLKVLNLHANSLYGDVPAFFSSFGSFVEFTFDRNYFVGSIPSSMYKMTIRSYGLNCLTEFDPSGNRAPVNHPVTTGDQRPQADCDAFYKSLGKNQSRSVDPSQNQLVDPNQQPFSVPTSFTLFNPAPDVTSSGVNGAANTLISVPKEAPDSSGPPVGMIAGISLLGFVVVFMTGLWWMMVWSRKRAKWDAEETYHSDMRAMEERMGGDLHVTDRRVAGELERDASGYFVAPDAVRGYRVAPAKGVMVPVAIEEESRQQQNTLRSPAPVAAAGVTGRRVPVRGIVVAVGGDPSHNPPRAFRQPEPSGTLIVPVRASSRTPRRNFGDQGSVSSQKSTVRSLPTLHEETSSLSSATLSITNARLAERRDDAIAKKGNILFESRSETLERERQLALHLHIVAKDSEKKRSLDIERSSLQSHLPPTLPDSQASYGASTPSLQRKYNYNPTPINHPLQSATRIVGAGVSTWSPEQVSLWLESVGVKPWLAGLLRQNGVGGHQFLEMKEERLVEMGISLELRAVLMEAVGILRERNIGTEMVLTPTAPPKYVQ
ncbi:hypothetical protein HDU97_006763 [Phlyctochytrium planicorne]|nr:hypothetical protein HDU97_006763 [Phlyctochytrium planicorne]